MLHLSSERSWTPPIIETVAIDGRGIDELYDAIAAHRAHLESDGELTKRRGARLRDELRAIVLERLARRVDDVCTGDAFESLVNEIVARDVDPYTAADRLLGAAG
jgi:LAO/AO transport system kinase